MKSVKMPINNNHDISNENSHAIKGIEGTDILSSLTTSTIFDAYVIYVFDDHDMLYPVVFSGFSPSEAEAVFSTIQPVN